MRDRVHDRLTAVTSLLAVGFEDDLTRSTRDYAVRWTREPRVRRELAAEGTTWLTQVASVALERVQRAVERGLTVAAAVNIARAVWVLLDQPEDAPLRPHVVSLGQRLQAPADKAGADVDLAKWMRAQEWPLLRAIRRVFEAP